MRGVSAVLQLPVPQSDVETVPGYASIESAGFERRPVRNAILAFAMLLIGAPFPFWYRRLQ